MQRTYVSAITAAVAVQLTVVGLVLAVPPDYLIFDIGTISPDEAACYSRGDVAFQ